MQVNRHRAQVEQEMALLYRKYAPGILSYVRMRVPSPEDAEDLVVEVFLAAIENAKFTVLSEKAKQSWLWRVTRNKVIDAYRRAKTRQSVTLDHVAEGLFEDEMFSPEYTALRQEDYIIGITQGRRLRPAPGSHAAFINSRLGIFYGVLYSFAILWLIIFPLTPMQIGILWITVVMFGSIIAGVWIQEPVSIVVGVGITLMSVLGYYLLPHYFWLWSAVFAGLPLVGIGIYYLRQK